MDLIPHPTASKSPSRRTGEGSALRDLLEHSLIHERAGAAIPRDLMQFGFYGAAIITATGLLALALPTNPSALHSHSFHGFFLVLDGPAGDIGASLHSIAIPLIVLGVGLLVLDVILSRGARSAGWRPVVVAQAAVGGVGGVIPAVFIVIALINLVIWVLFIAAVLGLIGLIIAGLLSGS
jgi:hypothetical protein